MTENISESIVKTTEEDWAIFPFDQTSDGRRWVKLIEEIDELASKAEGDTTDCDEILMEDELAQNRVAQNRITSPEDGFMDRIPVNL